MVSWYPVELRSLSSLNSLPSLGLESSDQVVGLSQPSILVDHIRIQCPFLCLCLINVPDSFPVQKKTKQKLKSSRMVLADICLGWVMGCCSVYKANPSGSGLE